MTQTLLVTLMMIFSGYTGATSIPSPVYVNIKEAGQTEKISKIKKDEILWLARVIFSETKNKEEMRLVGWVVRNRVEAKYRGETYKEVALSASQFSGLSPKNKQYKININMDYKSKNKKWIEALKIANKIYFAGGSERPFSKNVKHFYSPVSIKKTPAWVKKGKLNKTILSVNTLTPRFAFYSDVR